jgi:hypothetical protein
MKTRDPASPFVIPSERLCQNYDVIPAPKARDPHYLAPLLESMDSVCRPWEASFGQQVQIPRLRLGMTGWFALLLA